MKRFTDKSFMKPDNFNIGDPKAYKILAQFLDEQGYFPVTKGKYINIANADGLLWQVNNRAVYPDPYSAPNTINSYDVVHQAFHALGAVRYGFEYVGRPKLCLLIEALAGCSQLYFEAASLSQTQDFKNSFLFNICNINSIRLGRPLVRLFNRAMENPFQTYKDVVKDQMKISFILLHYCKSVQKKKKVSPQRVRQRILKVKHLILLNQKPFASFVSYVGTFCGFVSSKQDNSDYYECLKILNSSKSMVDFIEAVREAKVFQKKAS